MAKAIKSNNPGAWIVNPKDKGRKSIKNGNVYLNDGDYFEIELFNPLTKSVLAKIKLNGTAISSSGLIIRPGQRVYLDCFIDDKKKFIFKTYEIENVEESLSATKNNGLLEVTFYQEQEFLTNNWITTNYSDSITTYYSNNLSGSISGSLSTNVSNNIETGRVERGEKSNQKFEDVFMNFNNYSHSSVIIRILPESRKPVEVTEVIKTSKYVDLVSKLADLYKEGLLTEEEFIKLLSKI